MKKIRDMKALARESLLGKYGTVIGAYFLSGVLIFLSSILTVLSIVFALANTRGLGRYVKQVIPSFNAVPALSVFLAAAFAALLVFTIILGCWLKFGRTKLLLNICRGEKYGCSDIFYAFKSGTHPWRVIGIYILETVFVNAAFLIPFIVTLAAKVSGYNVNEPDPGGPWGIAIIAVNVLTVFWALWLSLGFTFADTVILDRPGTGVLEALKESLRITRFKKIRLFWLMTFSFIFWYILISISKLASLWVLPYIETTLVIFYLCARGEEFVIPANRPEEATVHNTEETGTAPAAPAPQENTAEAVSGPAAENVSESGPAVSDRTEQPSASAAPQASAAAGVMKPETAFEKTEISPETPASEQAEPAAAVRNEAAAPVASAETVRKAETEDMQPSGTGAVIGDKPEEGIVITEDEV